MAAYTAVLVSDTAVPAWHDGYRELPFVFTGSAAMAAGGLGLIAAPPGQTGPARNLALLGASAEAAAFELMTRRMGMVAEPYSAGRAGAYLRASRVLSAIGATGALLGRRSRTVSALAGAALLGASAATRWAVFMRAWPRPPIPSTRWSRSACGATTAGHRRKQADKQDYGPCP